MKSKKQSTMPDISKPKKRPVVHPASGQKLVIPKRTVVSVTAADADEPSSPAEPPLMGSSVSRSIDPKDIVVPAAHPQEETKETPAPAEEAKADPEPTPAVADPEPPAKAEAEPTSEPKKPEEEASDDASAADADHDTKADKTNPQVRKALNDAKREQELQKIIEDREYYVPINAVARKRSLKVSVGLIVLELILGLFLLNLMLDAGLIELLDKIPHTHFFNLR